MRSIFIAGSIIFQIFVLLYMAGLREMIVMTGKTVYLRTMPVDPRDPFRGDYVSLNYEISVIPRKDVKSAILEEKGAKFFVRLKMEENGLYVFDGCSSEMPAKGNVFIKGSFDRNWMWGRSDKVLHLKYGIEKYFVQQNKGLDIEKRAGIGNEIHVPLEVEVALGSDGTAVAKGFRWSPLGMGLQITENPVMRNNWQAQATDEQNAPHTKDGKVRRSPKIKLVLQNVSDKPLAIINLPDFGSFTVESAETSMRDWKFAAKSSSTGVASNADVIVLMPNEKKEFDFDFAEPRWYVEGKNGPEEIGTAADQWGDMFRIIYNPPSAEACSKLDKKDIIWHGKLTSRRFSSGRLD